MIRLKVKLTAFISIKVFKRLGYVLIFSAVILFKGRAQDIVCWHTDTAYHLSFPEVVKNNNGILGYGKLKREYTGCPGTGHYSIASSCTNCFNGNWISLASDHTEEATHGNMLIVNSSEPGEFLKFEVQNLIPGTRYEIAAWVANVFKNASGCTPTQPNLGFYIEASNRKLICIYITGVIDPNKNPVWQRFGSDFLLPRGETEITVTVKNYEIDSCANDFAIDDITLTPYKPAERIKSVKTDMLRRPVETSIQKDTSKKITTKAIYIEANQNTSIDIALPMPLHKTVPKQQPSLLTSRENALIKTIETPETELIFELNDDNKIDGDTITVYHNGVLIIDKILLQKKPVFIRVAVNKNNPHHELYFIAVSEGLYPPNTALLRYTIKGIKHEQFISTDDKKNAKIIIDWKE